MLRYIGHTSPECHLIPGEPLNLEAATPEGFSSESEEAIKRMVVHQKDNELQHYSKHKADQRSVVHRINQNKGLKGSPDNAENLVVVIVTSKPVTNT